MRDSLDADDVRSWSRAAVAVLAAHREEIDALNVYPVPDSDTGSNLLTTLRAADTALATAAPADVVAALAALAGGSAQGALGNSGFILSQILRGLADAAGAAGRCDARAVADGLDLGATLARTAVVNPVEGTVLTVARAAADAARGATLGEVITRAVEGADAALQHTPEQLVELARAGVVDAGGRGLLLVLAALARVVTGAEPHLRTVLVPAGGAARVAAAGGEGFGFEVQYLLEIGADAADDAVDKVRHRLAELGDSVVVVPSGPGAWNVHAHVDDVGAAIEVGLEVGRPHQISVVRFADEHGAGSGADGADAAVIAVAPGRGLAHLFAAEGVVVVEGGPDEPPSVDDVLHAATQAGASQLVLLPNAAPVRRVAEQAAEVLRAQGRRASVVPTRSPVQGLAAIAVHDATRRFDDDVVAMAEAAAATRFAELSLAREAALTAVGPCTPGDVLGLIDGEVVELGRGLLAVAFGLIDRLLGVGAELMTIVVGADAPVRTGELLEAHVRARSPLTDVAVYDGGQAEFPVIIGVE